MIQRYAITIKMDTSAMGPDVFMALIQRELRKLPGVKEVSVVRVGGTRR